MNRKPLGRGLDALIGTPSPAPVTEAAPAANRPGTFEVALDELTANRFQPRMAFHSEAMKELVDSVRSLGVLEPLIVRPAPADAAAGVRFELIAGERRMRAAREAGLTTVPVVVREMGDRESLEVSLIENLVRNELNAVEEGHAFWTLWKKFELSHDDIAARIGKSRPYVTNQIRLLELPIKVLEWIAKGELNPTLARSLIAIPGEQQRIQMAADMIKSRMTVRDLEGGAQPPRRGRPVGRVDIVARRTMDPNIVALVDEMRRALKRKVRIIRGRGKTPGRVELEFYNDSDLDALTSMLLSSAQMRASA